MIDPRIAKLEDLDALKNSAQANLIRNPLYYGRKMDLIVGFFKEHPDPVDIVVICYSGLSHIENFAYVLEGNNVLLYKPRALHRRPEGVQEFQGHMHPNRDTLVVDENLDTGLSLLETVEFLLVAGYSKDRMFGYMDNTDDPELAHINKFLQKVKTG